MTGKAGLETRFAMGAYFALCAILALGDANVALFMAMVGGFFLIKSFGLIEYISCGLILLVKSQTEIVLSSSDLAAHAVTYNLISSGEMVMENLHWGDYEDGEFLLPSIYWIVSHIFPYANESVLAFVFVLCFLTLFYPLLRVLHDKPIVLLFVVLFLDVNLIVHLFRQSIASILMLLGLVSWLAGGKINGLGLKGYSLVATSFITHLTNLVFLPLMFAFRHSPLVLLKVIIIVAGYFAFGYGSGSLFQEVIGLLHGLPIVGKASYALVVWESGAGIRSVALLAIVLSLFLKEDTLYLRIFLGFSALMLVVYNVPILSARVGLIGTGILTGLPIGLAALKMRSYFVRTCFKKGKERGKGDESSPCPLAL